MRHLAVVEWGAWPCSLNTRGEGKQEFMDQSGLKILIKTGVLLQKDILASKAALGKRRQRKREIAFNRLFIKSGKTIQTSNNYSQQQLKLKGQHRGLSPAA